MYYIIISQNNFMKNCDHISVHTMQTSSNVLTLCAKELTESREYIIQ